MEEIIFGDTIIEVPPEYPEPPAHMKIYRDLVQGSEEWLEARRGILTASEMKLIVTPTLKVAANEKTRAHVYEIAAQRISEYVEPHYISDDMMRGHEDEVYARMAYSENFASVQDAGFITNNKWGFTLGYSPDGLVGDDGLIECKSRRQKYQVQTICENVHDDKGTTIPPEYMIQCQSGLLIAEREWIDLCSYCGGLPMAVLRVYPNEEIQAAILEAAEEFEATVEQKIAAYNAALKSDARLIPTERVEYEDILA